MERPRRPPGPPGDGRGVLINNQRMVTGHDPTSPVVMRWDQRRRWRQARRRFGRRGLRTGPESRFTRTGVCRACRIDQSHHDRRPEQTSAECVARRRHRRRCGGRHHPREITSRLFPLARVERVTQPVAQQVEGKDSDRDHDPRRDGHMRVDFQVLSRRGQVATPRRRRRLDAETKK